MGGLLYPSLAALARSCGQLDGSCQVSPCTSVVTNCDFDTQTDTNIIRNLKNYSNIRSSLACTTGHPPSLARMSCRSVTLRSSMASLSM